MRRAFRLRLGRGNVAREVDDELEFHLEMRTRKLIAAGHSPEAARQEALRQFGDVTSVRQTCVTLDMERDRAMRRIDFVDELRQDLAYAFRTLRRNPAFAGVIVLMLALGIGANTAIFTLINAVVLRPLPVASPERLVAIGETDRIGSLSVSTGPQADIISYPLYVDIRDNNRVVSGLLASGRTGRLDVIVGDSGTTAEHPRGRFVSGNYFSVLGVPALIGRTFSGEEDRSIGGSPVTVISHGYWTRRFDRDPSVIGRTVLVNGTRLTIIGVTPVYFAGEVVGQQLDLWIPVTMQAALNPNQQLLDNRGASWLLLLGRLEPGVTLQQAQAELPPLMRRLILAGGSANGPVTEEQLRDVEISIGPGAKGFSRIRATYAVPLYTLMAGVGVLLLVICSNVANLMLARAVTRTREMSVRMAIGAGRFRLVRQLLTESVVLALLGAVAGLGLAWGGSRLLLALAADGSNAIPLETRLDPLVLTFTLAVSLIAVLLCGMIPALRASRVELASTLRAQAQAVRGGALGGHGNRPSIGRVLVGANVALSLILLIGAALLVRSLQRVQGVDAGLDRDHLLIVDVDAITRGYKGDRRSELAIQLAERLSRLPGVRGVSYSENGIFSGSESAYTFQVPGFTAREPSDSSANSDQVGPGYVRALGARLLQGREFDERDRAGAAKVAMINETMARFYFGRDNPIGRTLRFDDTLDIQIVGVIADTRDHDLKGEPVRRMYVPYLQRLLGDPANLILEVRTSGAPANLTNAVRREILAVDPDLVIESIDPLSTLMRQSIREQRLVARLGSGFGALALALAAIGLYGILTYAISRRTGEIGLRVALGAQRSDVVNMVLLDALRLVLAGIVVGVPLALGSARLLRSQLHGVSPTDPAATALGLVVLMLSATIAALLPALRAARVPPMVALRQE
jgi:predicted permease